jgi:hypothetical protein
MLVAVAGAIQAQSWDTSGNGLLEGQYYFRQVSYDVSDKYGDLGGEIGIYGNITFDGNGKYSMTGQYNIAGEAVTFSGALTANGTYSIAASGYGFISSPCFDPESGCPAVPIYGLVSSQGIFVGSAAGSVDGSNDMMVAAPLATPAPTSSSFAGSWTCADFDLSSGIPNYALSVMFTLNPDGNGNLNAGEISGYEGTNTSPITQNVSGLTYTFSNGAELPRFRQAPPVPRAPYSSPDRNTSTFPRMATSCSAGRLTRSI